ncbi:MAG: histidine kinase [Acidimicrobiales bacterium]
MTWWDRWRNDLGRPERARTRADLPGLVGSAVVIVTIAQVSDPGTAEELAIIGVAGLGYVAWGLLSWLPSEVFALLVIVPVVLVVGDEGHLEGTFFLSVTMVVYTSWFLGSTTRALVIAGVAAVAPWYVATTLIPTSGIGWEAWSSATLFTLGLGRLLHVYKKAIDELEAAREALAEQAVAEERRRIARDLHDLAGHTLAAVMLHVTGARHVLRRDIDEAERALVDAETVGRASLDQIRATVAALRTDERGTDPALAGSADLLSLVDEYRRAGLSVETDIAPGALDIHGPTGTALHRIAREALANVAHHAPGNSVVLEVQCETGGLRLSVVDHGHRPPPATASAGHFGIIGMRERAHALGGELDAGPTVDGWRVEARLPPLPSATHVEVPS